MRRLLPLLLLGFLVVVADAGAHTLTYSAAKRAAQLRADQIAGQHTRVTTMLRESPHKFFAQAKWTHVDPTGCKGCGYDPASGTFYDTPTDEYCFVDLIVRFRSATSRRIRVSLQDKSCS